MKFWNITAGNETMKKISVILMAVIMCIVFSSFLDFIFGNSSSPGTKMAHKLSREIGKKIKNKYSLNFMGISEEGPEGKYKKIGLGFSCDKILSKDKGRILLLKCAHEALKVYNSHPEFTPYMNNVPFTNNNLIINIYIQLPKGPDVHHPNIGSFSFHNNILRYKTYKPQKRCEYFSVEKESFEEARRIVESQKANGDKDLE
jgi:hypothetical protein